jgi:hypothetical protein
MSQDLKYFFDFRGPEDSPVDPWAALKLYKEKEDDVVNAYLQRSHKLPVEVQGSPNQSILKFQSIKDSLGGLAKRIGKSSKFKQVLDAKFALYDVLHKNAFLITPRIREAWGTSVRHALSDKADLPRSVQYFLQTPDYEPDLGFLLHEILYNDEFPSIFYLNENNVACSGPWGTTATFAILNRKTWGEWMLTVHKDAYVFHDKLPASLFIALQAQCPNPLLVQSNTPKFQHILPEITSSLFYTFAVPAPCFGVLPIVDFYNETSSVNQVSIKDLLWGPDESIRDDVLEVLVWVGLPTVGEIALQNQQVVQLSAGDFRTMKSRNYRIVYDALLFRVLHLLGLVYSGYTSPVRYVEVQKSRNLAWEEALHILSSVYLFLFSEYPNFVLKVVAIVVDFYSVRNKDLVLVHLKQEIQRNNGDFSSVQNPTYLTRLCSEFRVLPFSDLSPVNYICNPNTSDFVLTSKLMIIVLRCKIAERLKWKPFYYMADLTLAVSDSVDEEPQSLAGIFSEFVPELHHEEPWIVPITVHTLSLGFLSVLLVIHPKRKLIEYYDVQGSQEALYLIQYELKQALGVVHEKYTSKIDFRSFAFLVMIQTSKYRQGTHRPYGTNKQKKIIAHSPCISFLFYFITFATQTPLSSNLSDRLFFLNEHLDLDLAKKMELDLYAAVYTWFKEYKDDVQHTILDKY